ncbi:FKBP-type peptidyl-prolyl cis-trans isomerase [Reinekea blandensis]|uniref:Peptidyl-prolyl cis-trans isomerase n=1 Tax=Reinekea blandensis MED297 TaxID=314283 RepID=A4BJL0_9GAMM|nr:FKBP-type peptidyl-prolyl cis-trans isomerase [Reinekea blandensis]EAR07714.1 Peptidylprolyl isomerase, FKBP-type [Reinekea sp. MED297] [Reinekea blandensis MED297]
MSAIHENSRVTLHFSLKLESGDIVDSTFGKAPAEMTMGDGNLPEGFEKHLLGMSAGDRRTVRVPPEDAFGQANPGNVQSFSRAQFAQAGDIEPGMVMSFEDASGSELPGVVSEISDDRVTVDFNHPLAGKALDFEVEILSVEAASHGH